MLKSPLLLSLAALFFAGCSTTNRMPAVALGPPEKAVVLSAKDRNKFVSLLPDGIITLNLDANTSAGYRWRLAGPPDAAVLSVTAADTNQLPAIALPPEGATKPEPQQWTFKSVGPGTTKVRLVYSRPNQPLNESAVYEFTVNAE